MPPALLFGLSFLPVRSKFVSALDCRAKAMPAPAAATYCFFSSSRLKAHKSVSPFSSLSSSLISLVAPLCSCSLSPVFCHLEQFLMFHILYRLFFHLLSASSFGRYLSPFSKSPSPFREFMLVCAVTSCCCLVSFVFFLWSFS